MMKWYWIWHPTVIAGIRCLLDSCWQRVFSSFRVCSISNRCFTKVYFIRSVLQARYKVAKVPTKGQSRPSLVKLDVRLKMNVRWQWGLRFLRFLRELLRHSIKMKIACSKGDPWQGSLASLGDCIYVKIMLNDFINCYPVLKSSFGRFE